MSATQVSFLAFALAQQAANDCTPPAESSPLPSVEAGLVAQSSVGGGECILLKTVYDPHREWVVDVRDDLWDVAACYGGMDAPRALPSGSHTAFICGAGRSWAYACLTGFNASRGAV